MTDKDIQGVTIVISALALLGSIWSITAANKYSRINVIHSLQQLVLDKAKDCNHLWAIVKNGNFDPAYANTGAPYIETVSEIIISLQLIDNSVAEYKQKSKIDFYLRQFWTQLDTSLRTYIMQAQHGAFHQVLQQQIVDIQNKFQPMF